jgi:hypothetical protein
MERTVGGRPGRFGLDRAVVQQRREERPVEPGEPHLLPAQLTFQYRELMTQHQYLGVFVPSLIGIRRIIAKVFVTVR